MGVFWVRSSQRDFKYNPFAHYKLSGADGDDLVGVLCGDAQSAQFAFMANKPDFVVDRGPVSKHHSGAQPVAVANQFSRMAATFLPVLAERGFCPRLVWLVAGLAGGAGDYLLASCYDPYPPWKTELVAAGAGDFGVCFCVVWDLGDDDPAFGVRGYFE